MVRGLLTLFFIAVSIVCGGEFALAMESCSSQGRWTLAAEASMNNLINGIQSLKSKKECSLFADNAKLFRLTEIKKLIELERNRASDVDEVSQLGSKIEGLRSKATGKLTPLKKLGILLLQETTLKAATIATDAVQTKQMINDSFLEGMALSEHVLDNINNPDNEDCVHSSGAQIIPMLESTTQLIGNLVGNGDYSGYTTRISSVLEKLFFAIRNSRFNAALQSLSMTKLWNTLSCLAEVTTDSFCQIEMHKDLQSELANYSRLYHTPIKAGNSYNPLESYFVLARDIPRISNWVLKIHFGAEPMTKYDANRKNEVWTDVVNFMKDENNVTSTFNYLRLTMESFQKTAEPKAQKVLVLDMIERIIDEMTGGVWGDKSNVNFITSNFPANQLPFLLMGWGNEVPPPITGLYGGKDTWEDPKCKVIYNSNNGRFGGWRAFLENNGQFHCSLDKPDELLGVIYKNYTKIMQMSKTTVMEYLKDFIVVDEVNLVTEALKDPGVSVLDSIYNVRNYLLKISDRLKMAEKESTELREVDESRIVINNIENLLPKLTRVLESLNAMKVVQGETPIKEAAENVIRSVYKELNVLYQQPNFLKQRIETIALYDYRQFIRSGQINDRHVQDLLTVSGNSIMKTIGDSLNGGTGDMQSQALAELDLNNALVISNNNMAALETSVKDYFLGMLNIMHDVLDGTYGTHRNNLKEVFARLVKEAPGYKRARNDWKENPPSSIWNKTWKVALANIYDPKNFFLELVQYPFNGLFHGPRYPIRINLDEDKVLLGTYDNGEALKKIIAKLCIQSLAFEKNRGEFDEFCRGSILTNQFAEGHIKRLADQLQEPDLYKSVIVDYDHLASLGRHDQMERVCAFRNYKLSNQVQTLLYQFQSELPQ